MSKVAVVTGAARGLGKTIAWTLVDEGFTVAIHYRKSKDSANKFLDLIRKKSPDSIAIQADLTKEGEVKKMFEQFFKKFQKVDILVNNVGNFAYKPFEKTSNFQFRDILESNIYSTLFCSRAVLPTMRTLKSGQIINIGAVGCERITITKKSTPYFLAKNGVYVLTKIMAQNEAKYGIRINMISPASLASDIFKPSNFPMGRSANYEDVIKALKFLISDDAYYINGANLEVAGAFIPGMD